MTVDLNTLTMACDELFDYFFTNAEAIRTFLDSEDGRFLMSAQSNIYPQLRDGNTLALGVIIARADEVDGFFRRHGSEIAWT